MCGARVLASTLMNATVGAAMYDPSCRVRLCAVRLLADVARALQPAEVLRVALLKVRAQLTPKPRRDYAEVARAIQARDTDKSVRHVALELLARYEGAAELARPESVRTLLAHGAPPALTSASTWRYLRAHKAEPAAALRRIGAIELKEAIAPVLEENIDELYAACFGAGAAPVVDAGGAVGDAGDGVRDDDAALQEMWDELASDDGRS